MNYPRESYSTDNGQTFGFAGHFGYWNSHGGYDNSFNAKITDGPDGYLWFTYNNPPGHTLGRLPFELPYSPENNSLCGSHSGTSVAHAGEMLYTSEGYPMMFGDSGNVIRMRRGDLPNQGGTGTWPVYSGTEYINIPGGWLSTPRSSGKTSDGICRLLYWTEGAGGTVHMLSSDDISGTSWTDDDTIFNGGTGGYSTTPDPGLWVDDADRLLVAFRAGVGSDSDLIYGVSTDGASWDFAAVSNATTSSDDPSDTEAAAAEAFGDDFIFLSYETGGDVYCQWKMDADDEFSDPVQVNVHANAGLPDIYPNGAGGITFAYQAEGDTGTLDIFYRTCTIVEVD